MVGIVPVYIFCFVSALSSSMWCAAIDFVKQAVTEILLGGSMIMGNVCSEEWVLYMDFYWCNDAEELHVQQGCQVHLYWNRQKHIDYEI